MALTKRMGPVKPRPFQRKSISISLEAGRQRSWNIVTASMVSAGDTIAEFGLVELVDINDEGKIVTLTNVLGRQMRLYLNDEVLAFQ